MTTRNGNESIARKENFFLEEIKELELGSRRGKFIYNRTYNPVCLNKVKNRNGLSETGIVVTAEECEVFTKGKSKISLKTREGLCVV